jgi:hypothetical protein
MFAYARLERNLNTPIVATTPYTHTFITKQSYFEPYSPH